MTISINRADAQNVSINIDGSLAELKLNICTFKLSKTAVTAEIVLLLIEAAIEQFQSNPPPDGLALELKLTRKMHRIIAAGTYFERIKYIQLTGERDDIFRQEQFRDAVNFYNFNEVLRKNGIANHFASKTKSKRIIAVHVQDVKYDEEIQKGLHVMPCKHPGDNPVFVESENSLIYALNDCLPGTTLVIDGHWLHNTKRKHGVWDSCTAESLAERITAIVNALPGKVTHINLLGCQSGFINSTLEGSINKNNLFFKYKQKPELADREIASQRNRAIYVSSERQESVFDINSMAFQVLSKLTDKSIAVTATPKLLIPWPAENPRINIGSDTEDWKSPQQEWAANDTEDNLCRMLGEVKSVTQINDSEFETSSKRPWAYRI